MKAIFNTVNKLTLENKLAILAISFIVFLAVSVLVDAIKNGTPL